MSGTHPIPNDSDLKIAALAESDAEVAAMTAAVGAADLVRGTPAPAGPMGVGDESRARIAALAEAEAQRSVFLKTSARPLSEVASDLVLTLHERAREARALLLMAKNNLAGARLAVSFEEPSSEDTDAVVGTAQTLPAPSPLPLVAAGAALCADAAVVFGATSALLGEAVYATSADVPWSLRLAAAGTSLAALLAGGALAEVLVRWWLSRERRSLTPVAAAAGVLLVLLALALAAIRVSASDETASAGTSALITLALMSAFVLPILASSCLHAWLAARAAHRAQEARVSIAQQARSKLADDVESARRLVEKLEADLVLPGEVEGAFNAAVAARMLELRTGMVALERRARVNVLLRRLLVAMPPARKALLLRYAKDVAKAASSGASVILLILGIGCVSPPAKPFTVIAVCDGSGTNREAVCSTDALRALADSWVGRAVARPGSQFIVVTTGSGLADTHEALRVAAPGLTRDPRQDRQSLRRKVAAGIEDVVIPRDEPGRTPLNVSDGIAALHFTTRIVRELDGHDIEVVVLSDGRWVSAGVFNAERCAPAPEDAFARAKAAGMDIDLTGVARVRVCGLHTTGLTPAQATSRDRLVIGLLTLAHAPGPILGRSSCAGFFGVPTARAGAAE